MSGSAAGPAPSGAAASGTSSTPLGPTSSPFCQQEGVAQTCRWREGRTPLYGTSKAGPVIVARGGGPDRRVLPRGRLRSDEQLRRDRGRPAGPRGAGGVRRGGVLRGDARGARVRGADDAPRAGP